MKITIFTSNQPRHVALINRLASVAEIIYAVQEVSTVHPGKISDFYGNSEPLHQYMSNMRNAEDHFFPNQRYTSNKVNSFACKLGDLNGLSKSDLKDALNSDLYVVFGSSFIRGWLCDFLVKNSAINLHMGLSPYYRGAACNFWAIYDQLPNYVGATWHYLSSGLDSGPIIFHSIPIYQDEDAYRFTMKAVLAAQEDLISNLNEISLGVFPGIQQERNFQHRYSRYTDFTEDIVREFLQRDSSHLALREMLNNSEKPKLYRRNFVD